MNYDMSSSLERSDRDSSIAQNEANILPGKSKSTIQEISELPKIELRQSLKLLPTRKISSRKRLSLLPNSDGLSYENCGERS